MIFLVFFGLIAVAVIGLNIIDNSNQSKIEEYLRVQQCVQLSYVKGVYKGLCPQKMLFVKNGFSIDLTKDPKSIYYKDINSFTQQEKDTLILNVGNTHEILIFKDKRKFTAYKKKLQESIEK